MTIKTICQNRIIGEHNGTIRIVVCHYAANTVIQWPNAPAVPLCSNHTPNTGALNFMRSMGCSVRHIS